MLYVINIEALIYMCWIGLVLFSAMLWSEALPCNVLKPCLVFPPTDRKLTWSGVVKTLPLYVTMCSDGQHIPTGWWLVKTNSVGFLKHKDFVRKETIFLFKWTVSDNSGNFRQMRQIFMFRNFHRSCLCYTDLPNSLPHFGSIDLILNIPWNMLYIWLKVYSIWSNGFKIIN